MDNGLRSGGTVTRLLGKAAAGTLCALVLSLGVWEPAQAARAASIDQAVIDKLADELLASMPTPHTIAIRPFRESESPAPVRVAQMINDALVNAISRHWSNKHSFVTRDRLDAIFEEGNTFEGKDIGQLLEEAGADVQIIGSMHPDRDGLQIYYQAFELNGHQIASTQNHYMAIDLQAATALMLEQAIEEAAIGLAEEVKDDLRVVHIKGIYFQQTGAQTLFGRYVAEKFVEKLQGKVKYLRTMHTWVPITDFRNIDLEKESVEAKAIRHGPGSYLLTGSVWDFGDQVEISFKLKGTNDRVASRSVRASKDSIPDSLLPLKPLLPLTAGASATGDQGQLLLEKTSEQATVFPPRELASPNANDNLGPIAMRLSSDRGHNPFYYIGDTMRMVVQVSRDSHLHCFDQQSDGTVIRIFPNRFHPDSFLAAGKSVFIPNESMKFSFRFAPPAGIEHIRCVAVGRDIARDLPPGIAMKDFVPLPVGDLAGITRAFQALPDAAVSQVSMVVSIGKKEEKSLFSDANPSGDLPIVVPQKSARLTTGIEELHGIVTHVVQAANEAMNRPEIDPAKKEKLRKIFDQAFWILQNLDRQKAAARDIEDSIWKLANLGGVVLTEPKAATEAVKLGR